LLGQFALHGSQPDKNGIKNVIMHSIMYNMYI